MKHTNVLISGASIAGPALAYWLRRYGFTVTVVERAPALRPGGQAVDLRGESRAVVERMGLLDHARDLSLEQKGLAMVGATGKVSARLPADMFGGEGIISEIEILRGDLAQVLHDATLPATEYLFDDTVTAIDQDPDGVTVTFEKAPTRRFDLVIGADGQHSAVRGLAFGPEAEFVRPLGLYICWFTAPADDTLDGWVEMQQNGRGQNASIRPGRIPGETKAALAFRSGPVAYDRRDIPAQQQLVADRFAGLGWKVPWLVEAMRRSSDFAFDSCGQVRLDRWSRGRVALLGDAAYGPSALTGLGTSLALVGAYVLAGELAAARDDHSAVINHSAVIDYSAAFARYQEVMAAYVKSGQELPPMGVRGFAPGNRLYLAISQASMRSITRWPMRLLAEKQFAKAGDVNLPDYAGRLVA